METAFHTRHTLLERIQNDNDENSWNEFVSYYQDYIYLICRRMKLDHHNSQEIVQKTLLKLWKNLPETDCSNFRRFRAWLCRITGNEVKDYYRSTEARSNREKKFGNINFDRPEIDKIAEEEWRKYLITLAMERVRKSFSAQLMAVFDDLHCGLKREAVAAKHKVSVSNVSIYKHRVTKALCTEIRRLESELK